MKLRDCSSSYIYLHLSVESIVEQQVVSHADPVGLHGVPLPVVIVSNITWRGEGEEEENKHTSLFHMQMYTRGRQRSPRRGLPARIGFTR